MDSMQFAADSGYFVGFLLTLFLLCGIPGGLFAALVLFIGGKSNRKQKPKQKRKYTRLRVPRHTITDRAGHHEIVEEHFIYYPNRSEKDKH